MRLIRTFNGPSGYHTVMPVPTSTTTVIVGGILPGASFVLGAGGIIIGTLPPGISEVGGIIPVAGPGPENTPEATPSPTVTESASESQSQLSSSASSASASSSSCSMPAESPCDSDCFGPEGVPEDFESDLDMDDGGAIAISRRLSRRSLKNLNARADRGL
jgi:hypothetical protein